jgi:hypothetical protein
MTEPAYLTSFLLRPAMAPHPAVFSRLGVLDVLSSTAPRPSGRKPHWARHLAALATKPSEIRGPDRWHSCGNQTRTPFFASDQEYTTRKMEITQMMMEKTIAPEPMISAPFVIPKL